MPLPTPNTGESESDFIARCVASDAAQEFKDQKQGLAVCYSQWQRDKAAGLGKVEYYVMAQAVEQDGKKYALIEIVDENVSGPCESPPDTRVRINPAGKARALATLLKKPLRGPPELGHQSVEIVGFPVDFTSNHATHVTYEIPDHTAWENIRSGKWGPVSPRMTPSQAHYEEDVYVLDEWEWDDVTFVPRGAWSNAGVKSTCEGDPQLCGFHRAVAAALHGHGWEPEGSKPGQDVADYSPEGRQADREKIRTKNMEVDTLACEHDKVIAELTDKNKTLETELKEAKANSVNAAELTAKNKKLEEDLKQAKAATPAVTVTASKEALDKVEAELKAVKVEAEALKTWKQTREDADHMERVQAVLDLRVKAGLLETKDVAAAIETFKKLDNAALDLMIEDLKKVHGKFDSLPSGPKAKLIPSTSMGQFNPMTETVGSLIGIPVGQVRAAEQPGVKA